MKRFIGYQRLMYACHTGEQQGGWILLLLLPLILISPVFLLILCSQISSMMLNIRKKQSSALVLLPISDTFELVNHYAFGFVLVFAGAVVDSLILMAVYGLTFGVLGDFVWDIIMMFVSKPWEIIICFSFAVSVYMINVMLIRVISDRKRAWIVFMILSLSGFIIAMVLPRTADFACMSLMIMLALLMLCPWLSYQWEKRGVSC